MVRQKATFSISSIALAGTIVIAVFGIVLIIAGIIKLWMGFIEGLFLIVPGLVVLIIGVLFNRLLRKWEV